MREGEFIRTVLIAGAFGGAVLALIAFLLSRFVKDFVGRTVLTIGLFVSAGAYFGFAIVGPASQIWVLIELLQVIAFSAIGLVGWKGSAKWLALGWVLHPLWDFGMHHLGPGRSFAPLTYVFACIAFDWVVAAYVLIAYRRRATNR